MHSLQANGLTIHYCLDGRPDAPVILFANSLGSDLRIWDPLVAELTEDFRLLRYDLRGHGLTDVTPGPYTIAQLTRDAVALLDALQLPKVQLCGLSIGGMIGQQLAAAYPERVDRLILCDTSIKQPNPRMWDERARQARVEGVGPLVEGTMERWFTEPFRASQSHAVYRNMLARVDREGYASCCEALRDMDLQAVAPRIRAATLVVVGEQDPSTPPAAAQELAAAIPGARLEIIPHAAHIPCVEQPRVLAGLIRDFLRA